MFNNKKEENIKLCSDFCDTLVDIFYDSLIEEKDIAWKNFIKVEIVERKPRKGKNPRTNEVVTFPAVKSINCKMAKIFKDVVNDRA